MKNIQMLLSSLLDTHRFDPLSQHKCYRKFLELLPPRFQKAIAFVTVKNRQLMVALSHPGYKMELNYNKELLKSLLNNFIKVRSECNFMEADKIIIFQSKYHMPRVLKDIEDTIPYYKEMAVGDFKLPKSNPKLKELFSQIQEAIKHNREN